MSKPFAQPNEDDPPELPGDDKIPTQRPGPKPHEPSETDRLTVQAMVAGGICIEDIARVRGMSKGTLYKHYKHELENGRTVLNTMVIIEHIKRIRNGDFAAIKWWEQARMGWSEKVTIDDPHRDQPLRVIIELVGQAAPPAAKPATGVEARNSPRSLPGTVVQFQG